MRFFFLRKLGSNLKRSCWWRQQVKWVVPLAALVLVHELGGNLAGQKLPEQDWPAQAEQHPELQRGRRLALEWVLAPKPESTEQTGEESQKRKKGKDLGVLWKFGFVYNKPFHAVVMMLTFFGAAIFLIKVNPIWILPALVYLCAKVEEFYPITHWPMYSNPSMGPSWYCYLADGDGEALPVRVLCGETAPKLKKRMRSYTTDLLGQEQWEQYGKREDLPAEAWEICAERVLTEMVERSHEEGNLAELPPQLQLMRVDIHQQEYGFREEAKSLGRVVVEEVQPVVQ